MRRRSGSRLQSITERRHNRLPRSCSCIFEYCSADRRQSRSRPATTSIDALTNGSGTPLARARTMVTLCRALRYSGAARDRLPHRAGDRRPAARVGRSVQRAGLGAVRSDGRLVAQPADEVRAGARAAATRDRPTIDATSTALTMTEFSIRAAGSPTQRCCRAKCGTRCRFSNLTRLPVPMHTVMKILLLLPFAALITAFLRNVIGLGTFGTFSPALLAMSFIYADLKTGLAILVIVDCRRPGRPHVPGAAATADGAAAEHHPDDGHPVRRVRRFDSVLHAADSRAPKSCSCRWSS